MTKAVKLSKRQLATNHNYQLLKALIKKIEDYMEEIINEMPHVAIQPHKWIHHYAKETQDISYLVLAYIALENNDFMKYNLLKISFECEQLKHMSENDIFDFWEDVETCVFSIQNCIEVLLHNIDQYTI